MKTLEKLTQDEFGRLNRKDGSHMFFEHGDGRITVIPNHPVKK